jgi:hypothetical protein
MWQTILSLIFLFTLPAAFISLAISVVGVAKREFWLVLIGAILFLPFAYYLNGAPGATGFAILLPLFQVGSAVAVYHRNNIWAWLLLAPAFLASLWVVGVALVYQLQG